MTAAGHGAAGVDDGEDVGAEGPLPESRRGHRAPFEAGRAAGATAEGGAAGAGGVGLAAGGVLRRAPPLRSSAAQDERGWRRGSFETLLRFAAGSSGCVARGGGYGDVW